MQQPRSKLKELKITARQGDRDAAVRLLAHSVSCGHERLSVRRYLVARALGAMDLEPFRPHCRIATSGMTTEALLAIARGATQEIANGKGVHDMTAELLPSAGPLILPYDDIRPQFETEPRFCGTGSCVIGKVKIGARASIAAGVVIRADGHFVQIGDDFCIGAHSTVHIAHEVLPAIIGSRVTVGRNAVVHACTVGDDCVIQDDAVVLDGAIVESNVVIEAGAIVFPRSTLARGFVYAGCPAKPVRELRLGECAERAKHLREAVAASVFATAIEKPSTSVGAALSEACFIASNARLSGHVEMRSRSSVFFSCRLDAGRASIVVGRNTNIQDNTSIQCSADGVIIGDDSTVGHNVRIHDSRIGSRSLIGIGAVVSNGSIVEDDVLVAAGAVTSPYQILERGFVWGGRPARPIAELDSSKRSMMSSIIGHYCAYGDAYRLTEDNLAQSGESNGTSPVRSRHATR